MLTPPPSSLLLQLVLQTVPTPAKEPLKITALNVYLLKAYLCVASLKYPKSVWFVGLSSVLSSYGRNAGQVNTYSIIYRCNQYKYIILIKQILCSTDTNADFLAEMIRFSGEHKGCAGDLKRKVVWEILNLMQT